MGLLESGRRDRCHRSEGDQPDYGEDTPEGDRQARRFLRHRGERHRAGFLFPGSLAFSADGQTLYVSNLTLYLPYAGADAAIDSDWTLQVKGYTVSKISAVIPSLGGDDSQQ